MTRVPLRSAACPTCRREVGVQPLYNTTIHSRTNSHGFRIARHRTAKDGPICPGGGVLVPDELITFHAKSTAL